MPAHVPLDPDDAGIPTAPDGRDTSAIGDDPDPQRDDGVAPGPGAPVDPASSARPRDPGPGRDVPDGWYPA